MKKSVLFLCVHNAARSQIAEALLLKYGGDQFEVQSAGFEPTVVNPLVIEVLKDEGIDLSNKKTQSVYSLIQKQVFFGFVITVCSRENEKDCPTFPGVPQRLHWDLKDPEGFMGTYEEKLENVRKLKEQIKEYVLDFIKHAG
jgi:arsenate reductase